MKRKISLVIITLWILVSFTPVRAIEIYSFRDLEPLLRKDNDTTYVIHFWATWCVPCLKELPEFNKFAEKHSRNKIKILLVSLDFPKQIDSKLIPFIEKHNITSEVIVLDDPNQNYWIDKVSPDWSGAIPATLVYKNQFKKFYEKSLTYEELVSIINIKK
jgi:thiol-disulfide isomerase/thioredoxin